VLAVVNLPDGTPLFRLAGIVVFDLSSGVPTVSFQSAKAQATDEQNAAICTALAI
jgi:hypothetical protein